MIQRHVFHSLILASAGLLVFGAAPALGQTRTLQAAGSSLGIDTPCARSVTIQPDPSLTGSFTAQATAAHPEELAELVFEGGGAAKLHGPEDECWGQNVRGFTRTMDIVVHVPTGVAIAIAEASDTKYVLGDIGGKLTLDLSGAVQLQAVSATDVSLDMSGTGSVAIGHVDGSMKTEISGAGEVRIDRGTIPDLNLSMSGSGKFTLSAGTVKQMPLEVSGDATVRIGGTVGDSTISLSGSGTIQLAKVTGSLTKEVDGDGTVTVGGP